MLLGDISILIPSALESLSHLADSVGIAYTHEAGGSSQGRHSSIPSSPITTPGSVEHSIGTLPGSTESPSRSLKTKELIPPPDGGPQPLTDTPTPCGCGKTHVVLTPVAKAPSLDLKDIPTLRVWVGHSPATRPFGDFDPCGVSHLWLETWRHPRRPFILYEDFPNHAAIPHLRWGFLHTFQSFARPRLLRGTHAKD